ncbi:Polysaccharide deacetylase [Micromonospora viridifaciens]|uniref:Polysaccharide deacetylase n=1 Tax=Micromonospora viridifaciens TaxID=1881 RepID=A0A1C4YVK9_MICVI|nr:phosphotransferase [Micromonospora viridifaciens]SCF24809.1 Polysaccharide deacetylase [Micromonospora viridifaciens]
MTTRPVSVCLTFDHLGAALDVRLGRASSPDSRRHDLSIGFPRLLGLLDEVGAPATFFCEGWSALHHPQAIRALLARGHDVGLHGWVHERWTELSRVERRRILFDGVAALRLAGVDRPSFRAPGGLLVDDDPDLLAEVGITEDSSIPAGAATRTVPALLNGSGLVNVPFVWPAVDYWAYQLNPDDPATPDDLPHRWRALLDQARQRDDRLLVLVVHPGVSGSPDAEFAAVQRVVREFAACPDVQFRTIASIAAQYRGKQAIPDPGPRPAVDVPDWFAARDDPPEPPSGDDPDGWLRYLVGRGLVSPDAGPRSVLVGGVSASVVRVGPVVVKRPRRRLDVPFDWQAGTNRIFAEATAMRLASGLAPAVLHVDELHQVLVQRFEQGTPWKAQLLAGRVDQAIVGQVAEALRAIRLLPTDGIDGADRFHRLRLDPYFWWVAKRHPQLRPALASVVDRLASTRTHVVHGDLSPKNLLVDSHGPDPRVVVLDWEVAHVGDPVFDLAFLLSHLFAKSVHRPAAAADLARAAAVVRAVDPDADEKWVRQLTGALLIARTHGKSRLEYLTAESFTRLDTVGRALLLDATWPDERTFW